jgi:ribosomal protein S2
MNGKEILKVENSRLSDSERNLARALLGANGHYGRQRRARRAPKTAIVCTRHGLDCIDLGQSAKALGRAALELARFDSNSVAWAGRERSSVAALDGALPEGALVHLGRWKPGAMSNREVGVWRKEPIEAFVACGSGMEIALGEARARGAYTVWIADTHCDPRLADETIWINASRMEALGIALSALSRGAPVV